MVISRKFLDVLAIILDLLRNQKISWVLVGSTSLVLQGVNVSPKDIDILTDKKGALLINQLFKKFEVKPVKFSRSEMFESYFGEFNITNVKIEVMGNLKSKYGKKWVSQLNRIKSPIFVNFKGLKIPVSSLRDQFNAYEKLGRKKDYLRVRKIKEFLQI